MDPANNATNAGATVSIDTDVLGPDDVYVPPLLLLVFGLPLFLTLIYFMLQFSRPDRFGRIDRTTLEALQDQDDEPDDDESSDADPADEPDRSGPVQP